jgi:hypothetical protein
MFLMIKRKPVLAKKSGAGAARSRLLKLVMPAISGKRGEAMAAAAERGDEVAFQKLWGAATQDIILAMRGATGGKQEATATAKKRTRT